MKTERKLHCRACGSDWSGRRCGHCLGDWFVDLSYLVGDTRSRRPENGA